MDDVEHPTTKRSADDDQRADAGAVVEIHGQWIREYGRRFRKGDALLLDVRLSLC
jgi:hypothetical protein